MAGQNKSKSNKILVITHVNYANGIEIHGLYHNLINYLSLNGFDVDHVFHPLEGGRYSYYNNQIFYRRHKFQSINYIYELLLNIKLCLKSDYSFVIAIDPLNGISCSLAKKLKNINFVYFSADYADQRFKHIIKNWLYHFADKCSINAADHVWAVSTRIIEKRAKQTYKTIHLIPNSPSQYLTNKPDKIEGQVVLVSTISKSINFDLIISAIDSINMGPSNIKLIIIGDGPKLSELQRKIFNLNLDDVIEFTGALDHDTTLNIISQSKIGLAIYSGESSWNYYGDSMKVREYASQMTPIIVNDIPSTADDVKKFGAGIVLDSECTGLKDAILTLLNDGEYYEQCIKGCINLSKRFDYSKCVDKAIDSLKLDIIKL